MQESHILISALRVVLIAMETLLVVVTLPLVLELLVTTVASLISPAKRGLRSRAVRRQASVSR